MRATRSGAVRTGTRPRLVVSQCLLGCRCRYDGKVISAPAVLGLAGTCELVPVCPELGIGLTVPRPEIRLVRAGKGIRMIQAGTGCDLTRRIAAFSAKFFDRCRADGFILKARSPSCAVSDAPVYDELGQETGTELPGVFTDVALDQSLFAPVEDEEGLRDPDRMAGFITRLLAPRPESKKRRSR